MLKPEVDTSLEKISLENGITKLHCVWSNMFTLNKTHSFYSDFSMFADDFRKHRKNAEIEIF